MTKLAPILKEISKNVRVGGYDGSRSHDGKLHETFALSRRSGRGPKSIIWTPAMAKHNSRAHRKLWRQVPGISAPSHQTPTRLLPPSSQAVSSRRTFAWLISDAQERHALPQRR